MEKERKEMKKFRDFLKEELRDKALEKDFFEEVEKARISVEIAYHREKAGLTQAELARKINTSQSAVARLENPNYHSYSIAVLRRVAGALGLELAVTFREKGEHRNEIDEETCQAAPDNKEESRLTFLEKKLQDHEELIKKLTETISARSQLVLGCVR